MNWYVTFDYFHCKGKGMLQALCDRPAVEEFDHSIKVAWSKITAHDEVETKLQKDSRTGRSAWPSMLCGTPAVCEHS